MAARDAGVAWQSVVDSIRPITTELWQTFDRVAQERFLRHARPWWDVHRHRMAPPVGQTLHGLVTAGDVEVRAGRIEAVDVAGGAARVTYRPRGRETQEVIAAQRVINATGAIAPDRCGNPLLQSLIDRGLVTLDCHRLGLQLAPDFAAIGAAGAAVPGLWAVGPLGVGAFWECTAVPDLRHQAVFVAERVAAALAA